jgi:hypothetical protein
VCQKEQRASYNRKEDFSSEEIPASTGICHNRYLWLSHCWVMPSITVEDKKAKFWDEPIFAGTKPNAVEFES